MRPGIYRRDEISLEWGTIGTGATNVAPSTDTEIDCRNAKAIIIQVDQSSTTYPGNNTDINVITRSEGATTYDNVPFTSTTVASASVESFTVEPAGFAYMKLRADNNDTSNLCAPKVIVQIVG